MPMSTNLISPQYGAAAEMRCIFLYESNTIVSAAFAAPAAGSPVSAFTPLGQSRATTGVLHEFIRAQAFLPDSRSSP